MSFPPPLSTRVAITVWAILLAAVCIKPLFSPFSSTVFITYEKAGEDFAAGERLYDRTHPYTDNFRYPPVVAAGFVPFTWIPPGFGSVVWRLIGVAVVLTGMAAWAKRLCPDISIPVLMLLAVPLSIGSLSNAQANTHIAGLMLWGSVLASRGRWIAAAVLVAGAALFKGYPIALGGLLVLLAPLRFGLPLLLAVAAGLIAPYAFQSADYVTAQYQYLFDNLDRDDRTTRPLYAGLQDFHMLLRIVGIAVPRNTYFVVQAGTGLVAAGMIVWLWRRGMNRSDLALNAFTIGICWMGVFGPVVEASTFILMAPVMAFELLVPRRPLWTRVLAYGGAAFFLTSVIAFAFPHAVHRPIVAMGILPLAALLLSMGAVGRVMATRPEQPKIAVTELDVPLRNAA